MKAQTNLKILLDDSLITYYYVGFILADGHVEDGKRLSVLLSAKDSAFLDKMAKYLGIKSVKQGKKKYKDKNVDVVYFSAQDSEYMPQIVRKFEIKSDKTHFPPSVNIFKKMTREQALSLFIGFIDGDGSIKKLNNRPDWNICIKCHKSWLPILSFFSVLLLGYDFAHVNTYGYSSLILSNTKKTKELKKFAIANSLPIMDRKWDNVNLSYVGKVENAETRLDEIKKMCIFGKSINEISKETGLKYPTVYALIQRNNIIVKKYEKRGRRRTQSDASCC